MIRSFKNKTTAAIFTGRQVKTLPPEMQPLALRKLRMIDSAVHLQDLRIPPGNRLEALQGDRQGEWSIRINRQWRVCFRFVETDAFDVEIVDYH